MEVTLQDKQQLLRKQIIQADIEPQSFMAFMGTIKQQGENINLQNWSLDELKQCVKQFKTSLQQEINRAKKQILSSRGSRQVVTNRIMQSIQKKNKVFYDRDGLWDYEITTRQQCKKIQKLFQFKSDPEIDYKAWEVKKTGGFLFGIGAKNQLQITLITNFTSDSVVRKSQDVDWLRQTLCSKYPGSYVPPLEQTRYFEPEDKINIMKRIKQIVLFLNSLVNFQHLVQNRYFHSFITEKDPRQFSAFRSKQTAVRTSVDISSIQNLQGQFSVEISKRTLNFIKQSAEYAKQVDQIHISLEANMRKVMGDLETLMKHTHYLANDFAKYNDKFNKMSEKNQLFKTQTGQKMSNILAFLNNLFTNVGNQFKKQMTLMKDMTEDFIRYQHAQWSQFLLHQKKFQHQQNSYLTLKYNLLKKKERNFNDISKWQLDDRQQFRMSRVNTDKMDKEDAYQMMFPKDNKIQEQTRIWQAYINDMYQKTFRILINEQQKQYLRHFGRFCTKMEKVNLEQRQMFQKFKEIFGIVMKSQAKQIEVKQ